jgi:hypothetical protein
MLDRQENQPLISHEVAHHCLRQLYQNLELHQLTSDGDSFAELLRHIFHCLKSYDVPYECKSWEGFATSISPLEIAADILAASINGKAYLFAFLLEVVGWGLEHTMVDEHGFLPHLSVNLQLRNYIDASRVKHLREWYVRGRVLVAWLEKIDPSERNLDRWLLDGTKQLLREINEFLDSATNDDIEKSGYFWRSFADRMSSVVASSEAAVRVKGWRAGRRAINRAKDDKESRYSLSLPVQARHMMVDVLQKIWEKRLGEAGAENFLTDVFRFEVGNAQSEQAWALKDHLNVGEDANNALFEYVYDIAWQCSLVRAYGIQEHDLRGVGFAGLYRAIIEDMSMGRRLFFIAMEFHFDLMQPPYERLGVALRVLERMEHDGWFGNPGIQGWAAGESIGEWINEGAELIRKTWCRKDKEEENKIQQQQGAHIENLLGCLDALWDKLKIKEPGEASLYGKAEGVLEIRRLYHYLSIHSAEQSDKNGSANHSERQAQQADWFRMKDGKIRMDMVSRYCLAHKKTTYCSNNRNSKFATIDEIDTINNKNSVCKLKDVKTLGQYDFLVIHGDFMPLARCAIPETQDKDENNREIGFFQRRETWVPVDLRDVDERGKGELENKEVDLPEQPVAFLFLQLQRRYYRFDFLHCLKGMAAGIGMVLGINDKEEQEGKKKQESETKKKESETKKKDRVFLTHGWADVVIVLGKSEERKVMGKEQKDPLAAAFEIQKHLFHHFLVNRTELILTADCLSLASGNEGTSDRYEIRVDVRVQECLFGRRVLEECVNKVSENLRVQGFSENTKVVLTPGQMDFSVIFGAEEDRRKYGGDRNEKLFEGAIKLFEGAENLIDRYETKISYLQGESHASIES